jgi:hypothetical protein
MSEKEISMDDFPSLLPYVQEIAERLLSGHASLMIGAGFSKNAESTEAKEHFKSWTELGEDFIEKLTDRSSETDKQFLNVLKLASEVEAQFGRPTLDSIIKHAVPDKMFQPSQLHHKVLSLPWVDVFTTNYDTLLERAAENILQFRYETIVNKEDLVWSTKPRIIKLHGSLPSKRPCIITEEDYRTYPQKYAPFVNTVQQSLLENTLCLIGFSGDDPNFLSWTGWIRDNLGKENSPKIYLIGVFTLSDGQKKLLEDRNVIPINLSIISNNYEKALDFFLVTLLSKYQDTEKNKWPANQLLDLNRNPDLIDSEIEKIIELWKTDRLNYPGWLIVPSGRREVLKMYTNWHFFPVFEQIKTPDDIFILYEFNWRIEHYLYPLKQDWVKIYKIIICKYNPFPNELDFDTSVTPISSPELEWGKIKTYWIELIISLMAFYRKQGIETEWNYFSGLIEKIPHMLSPEQYANYHYERCLRALFVLDSDMIKSEIRDWKQNTSLPYMEAKRAGLLAELGELNESYIILKQSLKEVRSRLTLSPTKDDYTNISQESYILLLLDYVADMHHSGRNRNQENENEREEHRKRLQQIVNNDCDPWKEYAFFENRLRYTQPPYKTTEKNYGYFIDDIMINSKFGEDIFTINSYNYLNFIEKIGIPFRIGNFVMGQDAAIVALERIVHFSPHWSLITLVRSGDTKNVNKWFTRYTLMNFTQKNADALSLSFLDTLNKSAADIEKTESFFKENFISCIVAVSIQALSHLTTMVSFEVKEKILQYLYSIYKNQKHGSYFNIGELLQRTIESLSNDEKQQLLPLLITFPIVPDNIRYKYHDSFSYKDISTEGILNNLVNQEHLNNLLNIDYNTLYNSDDHVKIKSIRNKYLTRLIVLWSYGLFDEKQIEIFTTKLWEKTDKDGFPSDLNLFKSIFLWLPSSPNINVTQLYKKYICYLNLPSHVLSEGHLVQNFFEEIISSSYKTNNYSWTEQELDILIEKIFKWWNKEKNIFDKSNSNIFPIQQDPKYLFYNISHITKWLFLNNADKLSSESIKKIQTVFFDFSKYNLPHLEAKASLCSKAIYDIDVLVVEIENALVSNDEDKIIDATNALIALLELKSEQCECCLESFFDLIKIRSKVSLAMLVCFADILVKKYAYLINDRYLYDLELGLSYLIDETVIEIDDSDEITHNKLNARIASARLAHNLKMFYSSADKELPNYLNRWEEVCNNPNEFSEVRNAWVNCKK